MCEAPMFLLQLIRGMCVHGTQVVVMHMVEPLNDPVEYALPEHRVKIYAIYSTT